MKKRGIATDYLIWILIAAAVLIVLILTSAILKQQGFNIIDRIKAAFSGR